MGCTSIYNMCIEQGTDFELNFSRKDDNGEYVSLVGCKASLTARYGRYDGEILFEATTENGMLIVEEEHFLSLAISHEITETFKAAEAVYDLDIEYSNGMVERILKGNIQIYHKVVDAD